MITQAMEYLTENTFSVYPFRDNTSITPVTGALSPLPTDVFVDAQFIPKNNTHYKRVFLYSFELYNSPLLSNAKAFKFIFWITDESGIKQADMTFEKRASDVVKFLFFSYSLPDGSAAIKIVPGPGMLNYLTANLNFYLRFYDSVSNTPYLELESSTVLLPLPVVDSIAFLNNWSDGVGTAVATYTTQTIWQEGANIDLISVSSSQEDFNVAPTLGTGLFNPCLVVDPPIRSINAIGSSSVGNFIFQPDSCLGIAGGANAVTIVHTCAPKCTEVQVSNLAYYINRIKDAIITLSEFANTNTDSIKNDLFQKMADYQAKLDAIQSIKAPYIEVESAKANSSSKSYISYAVGIYDPNKSSSVVHLTITPDLNATADPANGFRHIDGTAILKDAGNEYILPFDQTDDSTWKMTDRTLPCLSSTALTATYTVPRSEVDRVMLFKLSESTSASHPSTSAKLHIINPNGIYFTVKTRRVWTTIGTPRYVYTFTIDLFKANLTSSGSNAINTTFNMSLPGTLTYATATAVISKDGTTSTISGPSGNMISSMSIDYAKKNFITFSADYVPANPTDEQTLTFSISPTLTISGDSFSKTTSIR